MLTSSKLQPCLLKQPLNTQTKLKELQIMYRNAMYIGISWYNKIADLPLENAYVSRTQGVCHMIYILFGSSLGKVYVCQVSSF